MGERPIQEDGPKNEIMDLEKGKKLMLKYWESLLKDAEERSDADAIKDAETYIGKIEENDFFSKVSSYGTSRESLYEYFSENAYDGQQDLIDFEVSLNNKKDLDSKSYDINHQALKRALERDQEIAKILEGQEGYQEYLRSKNPENN